MTKENLDDWCSFCGCEGGCHYDCLRELSDEELDKLENIDLSSARLSSLSKKDFIKIGAQPFDYDFEEHCYKCPVCGCNDINKSGYNDLHYETLSGAAGYYWICKKCGYRYKEICRMS